MCTGCVVSVVVCVAVCAGSAEAAITQQCNPVVSQHPAAVLGMVMLSSHCKSHDF